MTEYFRDKRIFPFSCLLTVKRNDQVVLRNYKSTLPFSVLFQSEFSNSKELKKKTVRFEVLTMLSAGVLLLFNIVTLLSEQK